MNLAQRARSAAVAAMAHVADGRSEDAGTVFNVFVRDEVAAGEVLPSVAIALAKAAVEVGVMAAGPEAADRFRRIALRIAVTNEG